MINNIPYNNTRRLSVDNKYDKLKSKYNNNNWKIFPAEVLDIILDATHPQYVDESSIGSILFKLSIDLNEPYNKPLIIAKPISAYIKQYPIIHEIVAIIESYDQYGDIDSASIVYYYTDIINIWGLTNHNALPNTSYPTDKYDSINFSAFAKKPKTNDYSFGNTFTESTNVQNLKPNEGDIILLGRWGQSIRFGRTVSAKYNTWSPKGNNGDPIIILQASIPVPTNSPKIEDINADDSSIYIASKQTINLKYSSTDFSTHKLSGQKPVDPTNYLGSQVVVSSDRIIINSRRDHTILSSAKSISLSSKKSINIDTDLFLTNANKYQFGINATNSAVLGTKLIEILTELISSILADTRSVQVAPSGTGTTVGPPLNNSQYTIILQKLNTILSTKMLIE